MSVISEGEVFFHAGGWPGVATTYMTCAGGGAGSVVICTPVGAPFARFLSALAFCCS
jgi:hypothetical protein